MDSYLQMLSECKADKNVVVGLLVGTYVAYKAAQYLNWKVKNVRVMNLAKKTIEKRNSQRVKFKTDGLDVDYILSLDVAGLRKQLLKGTFTSENLVNVFGERCQTFGRNLCLSAEECFTDALNLARKRDEERAKAIKDGTAE